MGRSEVMGKRCGHGGEFTSIGSPYGMPCMSIPLAATSVHIRKRTSPFLRKLVHLEGYLMSSDVYLKSLQIIPPFLGSTVTMETHTGKFVDHCFRS